ncbi:sphingomyelin phosphodiesterase 4-like [Actinia tenebrosa]|uniref:Sphingomyelin phosphodiesterase 4-like n=1 Tax=Actinia tenebrosa TaxID=6105 RepID=A0A6P8HLQ0_ACTTE|nr:sphingomyelin phosphodiesterase 4-like [Actinia tenebrosa]
MNSDDFKRKTSIALQKSSLSQRCEEVQKIIDDYSTKELHGFFPELLGSIFGYSNNNNDWGLRKLSQRSGAFEQLSKFLGPSGAIFKLIDKLQVDGYLKYEFFIKCLPMPSQNSLAEGNIPVLYHNKIHISNTASSNSSRVVLLDAFEYFMFHFAYYLVYQQNISSTSQDSNGTTEVQTLYLAILESYLTHFLSPATSIQPNTSTSSSLSGRNQAPWYSTGSFHRLPQNQAQFSGLIRASPSGHIPPVQGHSTYDHSTGEIWKSETFLQILIEFWLNQNTMDSVTSNVLSHGQVYFMPSVDLVQAVRMLIKQVHLFVYDSGIEALNQSALSPIEELKRNVIQQMLQKKLYCFIRHGFAHWPLDPSFRVIVETWLSFIQPWRYAKNPQALKTDSTNVFSQEWTSFVQENFLFYTEVLQEFVLRGLKLDLYSHKDVFILVRVTKVFAQEGLADVIQEVEKLLVQPSVNAKGPLRGSPSSMGVSLGSSLRSNMMDLEGPSFSYVPIFQEPGSEKLERLRFNISSALANIRNKHPGMAGQTTQAAQGPMAWFKSLLSGEFFDEDYSSKRDTDKVALYLEQSYESLASIVKVSSDVTDSGDQTIPRATPSGARDRTLPSLSSSTSSQGSIPECIQNERGQLIVTHRGRFQMINGLRRFEVQYTGDPELQPIRSYENPTLVRLLYRFSTYLNSKIGDHLHQTYNNTGYLSTIACTLSPCLKTPSHNGPGTSPVSNAQTCHAVRDPRISLRFLASYKTMFYLIMLYLLCKVFSLKSLTILALFILVLFFSFMGHVCPKHCDSDTLQKKLF